METTLDFDILEQHKNRTFVETGTWKGFGVDLALRVGFEDIRSVELENELFLENKKKFEDNPKVKLFLGSSGGKLSEMIKDIDHPCTFWLDAHYRGSCPVLKELEAIKKHPVKNHTILIDDMESFRLGWLEGVQIKDLIKKLFEINPQYKIAFVNSYYNILLAKPI